MGNPSPVARSTAELGDLAARQTAGIVVHERLAGRGAIYEENRVLATADYSLKDVEEVDRVGSAGRDTPGTPVGLRTIYGTLITLEAGVLAAHVGRRLHLKLADGRVLAFTVAKVMGPHRHLVQALGEISPHLADSRDRTQSD